MIHKVHGRPSAMSICSENVCYLMPACVQVMKKSSRNKKKVILMAVMAIVPSTVEAYLGFAM